MKILFLLFLAAYAAQYSFSQESIKIKPNGWYAIKVPETDITDREPIVTVTDFEKIQIDSIINSSGIMVYQIIGKIKEEKINVWADATEKSIGNQIGFIYDGHIIASPKVNQRIDSGNFAISTNTKVDLKQIYNLIYQEMIESTTSK